MLKKRKGAYGIKQTVSPYLSQQGKPSFVELRYSEIRRATNNFNSNLVIGEGGTGFGKVYKGTLRDGWLVAVKRYEFGQKEACKKFLNEVKMLSYFHHRNIVSLLGYYADKKSGILVYEYANKGSLGDHLFVSDSIDSSTSTSSSATKLSWLQRLTICVQTAEALHYLHSALRTPIIHNKVEVSSILLGADYTARLANFGFSCAYGPYHDHHYQSQNPGKVASALQYIDPISHPTEKCDVYSFGVVLLEVLCARPAIIMCAKERQKERNLADWGILCQKKGQLYKIIDPALVGCTCASSLIKFGQTAEMCLRPNRLERPDMRNVLRNLESALKLQQVEASEHSLDWTLFERTNRLVLNISYGEIKQAVNRFSPKAVMVKGGFGKVYKGSLCNGVEVTLKKYNRGGSQGSLDEFRSQIMLSSQVQHPNIVSLIGYCEEWTKKILVYEHVENKNLADHLNFSYGHSANSSPKSNLSWKQRLQICVGSAEALHYLHSGCERKIIHGDVTPFNIFLDENCHAKVALYGPFDVHKKCATRLRGTYGYVDPEYFRTTDYTEECDVYAFGVLLIEVLCARRCLELIKQRLEWRSGEVENIIDPALVGTICPASLKMYCEVAENCLRNRPERPGMREVLWNLDYALQLQQTTAEREWRDDKHSVLKACSELLLNAIQSYASHILVEI